MKLFTFLILSIPAALPSCTGQNTSSFDGSGEAGLNSDLVIGDTVTELHKAIFIIFQDRNKTYWFGSDGQGVYRYDGKTMIHYSTGDGLCNNRIREIQEDRAGYIYFTTLQGISKFDGNKFTTLTVAENKPGGNEWKLEPGDLWFKGEPGKNGPYRYDGKVLYSLEFPKHHLAESFYSGNPNPPYSPYEVYHIYKDKRGNAWFGTSNFGICRYDGKSLNWMYEEHLTLIAGGGSFGIRSIIEDRDGKFWFCNTRYRYKVLPDGTPGSSFEEKGNGLIKYQREEGIEHFKAPDGSDLIYFMSVIEDNGQNLWMATYNMGAWRFDGKTMTHYPVKDSAKNITLYSIYKDNNGDLWLGTHEAGAYKFNGETFEKFTLLGKGQ